MDFIYEEDESVNREDLLRMLDLTGKDAASEESTDFPIKEAKTKPNAPSGAHFSPTALDLDEWALRKGRDVLEESERLRGLDLDEHAVADFHASAFLPDPQLLEECADSRRREFLEQFFQTPEYQSLHATTMLKETASVIAATAFAEQYASLKKEEKDKEKSKPVAETETEKEMATLRAVGRALSKATEEVEEMRESTAALGMGPGSPGSNDPKAIAALYRRVRNNPVLKRICELAGRYRRVAQSMQRQKVSHGMDDIVGVTLGGELSRLLPVELAKLAIPELELDMLRRLIERQCMQREHRSIEPVGKGPIMISVDESGSMQGDKVHTAKALALAMAWVARTQRRWCALIAYSGDSGERLLALPPGRWDENKLADWLCAFIGGGSSLDVPVRELPRYYAQFKAPTGRTDVLFITDAQCRIPSELRDTFLAWKRDVKARLVTLVVGSEPGDLAHISDEVHLVRTLAVSEGAVERVLSI